MDIVTIKVGGDTLTLTDTNTRLYRFRDRPMIDHLFHQSSVKSCYIFDAPELFAAFEVRGSVLIDNMPTQDDENAYIHYCNQQLELELEDL